MPRGDRSLLLEERGSAAAELALVIPMLLILMVGTFELGNYFWNEHLVSKSVRDGVRYASRQPVTDFTCPGATIASTTETRIKEITRTGQPSGGLSRIPSW